MKRINDISYGSSSANKYDVFLPDGKVNAVFVYIHGGGIVEGDKTLGDITATYLANHGIATVTPNYRMYPEADYPDFIFDCAKVVALINDYMRQELNCDKLFVGGSSAGGYLSMMLCFDESYLKSVGIDNTQIAGYYHDAGQPTAHFNVLKYRGIDPRRIIVDETAPLYHIKADMNYPPMHFVVSDNDMQNRYEQTQLVLSTLRHFGYSDFGYTLMHGGHCEYCEKVDENGNNIFAQMILDFITKVIER